MTVGCDTQKSLADGPETAIIKGTVASARVAQLDRASVYGTDAANPQGASESSTYGNGPDRACHSLCQTDADFALLARRWPHLPDALKAGILAMVKDAGATDAPPKAEGSGGSERPAAGKGGE